MAVYKVAVYIFPGGDLLDFSSPIEIYNSQAPSTGACFDITSFAYHNPIKVQTGALVYVPNASFEEIAAKIEDYDILVIPGSHGDMIKALIASDEGKQHSALIKKIRLASTSQRSNRHKTPEGSEICGHPLYLQSVCTCAILVATSGVPSNRTVTTHHLNFDELKEITDQTAGDDSKITIVKKRWVDAGTTDAEPEL